MPVTFAICNEIFRDWKLEDAFRFIAATGYDAVEIAPFTLAPRVTDVGPGERGRIRSLAAANRLRISGIHWVLAQTEGFYVTHPDQQVRARTAAYFCDLVDFCADVGGRFIVVGSPKQRSLMPGVTRDQAWQFAQGVFAEAVRYAERREITLCLEPLAPSETDFINTAAEAVRFVQQIRSPRLKVILDVKAMSSEGRPLPEIIRETWPNFAYFHANDVNLKGPGFGSVDFVPIAAALNAVGYQGTVSVEVFDFTDGAERIATRSLETLRAAFR